jgi:hypothetical protein
VDPSLTDTIHAAQESVTRLVETCRKGGSLYKHDSRATAQVSRTGKWLLNAITALNKSLDTSCAGAGEQGR